MESGRVTAFLEPPPRPADSINAFSNMVYPPDP